MALSSLQPQPSSSTMESLRDKFTLASYLSQDQPGFATVGGLAVHLELRRVAGRRQTKGREAGRLLSLASYLVQLKGRLAAGAN